MCMKGSKYAWWLEPRKIYKQKLVQWLQMYWDQQVSTILINHFLSKRCRISPNITLHSLMSIRQNYNLDMLAMIWHEIVCWFLKIYQNLKRFAAQEHRIVFVLNFRCAEQFYVSNMQEQSKAEIRNHQTIIRHLMA